MHSRPRVALCMEYPIAQAGGVEVLVAALLRGLAQDFELVLVSQDQTAAIMDTEWGQKLYAHLPWQPEASSQRASAELAQALRSQGVRLAHFHFGGTYAWQSRAAGSCPVLAVKDQSVPVLITNHWVQPPWTGYCGAHRSAVLKRIIFPVVWINRLRVLHAAERELCVSRGDQRAARRRFWPERRRIGQLYHSLLDEAEPPPAHSAAERPPAILSVGTICERKGQSVLLEAAQRLSLSSSEWKLRIVGRVGEEDYYKGLQTSVAARKLGARVEWVGPMSAAQVAEAMSQAAIFAMPSLSEGLGLSLQEALFRGCAAVGSAVGGIPELITHGETGLLTPPGNSAALATALGELIENPRLRAQLGQQARASILTKGMTVQRMIAAYARLYRELLAGTSETS